MCVFLEALCQTSYRLPRALPLPVFPFSLTIALQPSAVSNSGNSSCLQGATSLKGASPCFLNGYQFPHPPLIPSFREQRFTPTAIGDGGNDYSGYFLMRGQSVLGFQPERNTLRSLGPILRTVIELSFIDPGCRTAMLTLEQCPGISCGHKMDIPGNCT